MVYDAVAQHRGGSAFLDIFKRFINKKGLLPKSGSPASVQSASSMHDVFGHFPSLKETEEYLIADALKRAEGNQGIAASMLGISRQALNRRLKNKE